ncbi:TrmH family RNA methyltransferase [Calycomorphotria hydatis]|uniref:23S rRNA (Uridine(2479)-2'-O)-methyltransferase n=1 Tax=Calycomorphotria hydatis TaxID=2528027 RepID=A0A517TBX7_9PLAN|nr:RNA methyltransferase [Calycomorphotria hydatis]QDT65871.1 23S rRNA (uridine(2479)-2'-O)-methyltransferase [Calycomorphotria hydatis]
MHERILRFVRQLQLKRSFRDKRRLFCVEGVRNFIVAVDSAAVLDSIIYSPRLLTSDLAEKLIRHKRRDGIPVHKVTPEAFRSISQMNRASGVAAVVKQPLISLSQAEVADSFIWLVLSSVRSPGNLGTLLRTSAAIGGSGLMIVGDGLDPFHPATVRSSMSALFQQQFVHTTPDELSQWATRHKWHIVGASPDGEATFIDQQYCRPTLIVLGDERKGLGTELRGLCDQLVRIPMLADADSLNLGVAGSLMLYEVARNSKIREQLV